ncbi:MAG: tyrosine-type recombinase/integrase [Candidatus Hodarchaeota archaeon]
MQYSKEWLSKKEIKRIFLLPEITSRDLLIMKVAYSGAFRIGEVINSHWEDYKDEDAYYFLVLREQKTDKRNWEKQPIQSHIFGEVRRYCENKGIKLQDPVFQSNRNQKISYNTVYKLIQKWVNKAGINKKITTHSFRRSRATHMLDDGMDLYKVSQFLRHSNIDTTMKYLKISKKSLYDSMEKLDKKQLYEELL